MIDPVQQIELALQREVAEDPWWRDFEFRTHSVVEPPLSADCDWCATSRHARTARGFPDHIGMLNLCINCVRGFELQQRLRMDEL